MAIAKVILNGVTQMDVTQKTVTAGSMLSGTTALKNDGTDITGSIASKTSSDLTVNGATVTAPAGFYPSNASKSVASGSATTPATTITANPTVSVNSSGLITASVSKTQSVTPSVSAGYVSNGTAGTITVSGSGTNQLATQAAQTIHPSTTDQTISPGRLLTGTQTFKAVTTTNLTAANIVSGVTVKVGDSTDDDCVASVTGTAATGGNDFIITLSKNASTGVWEPDCTFAEAQAAYNGGKNIVFVTDTGAPCNGAYEDDAFSYGVEEGFSSADEYGFYEKAYVWDSTGISDDGSEPYYSVFNATAVPADVASGKVFYNADGKQTGTASGGGGEPIYPADRSDVNFIDYDGTILYSYTAAEAAELTTLPANPSHSGLTAQGWNYTLAQMKTEVTAQGKCDIGQMYVTSDGKTRIYCTFQEGRLSPYLGICPNGTVIVDWGDGSNTDTLTGTSLTTRRMVQHTYASAGNYVITLTVSNGNFAFYGASAGAYLLTKNESTGNESRTYLNTVTRIELGVNASIGKYAFENCCSLMTITIPSSVTSIMESAFRYCCSLVSVTVPSGVTEIGNYGFQTCSALSVISIPSSMTTMGYNNFQNCYALQSIVFPSASGITSLASTTFQNCYALTSITIPSSVAAIGNSLFRYCYALASCNIPSSATQIVGYAFQYCYALATITIPSGVTSIGDYAFHSCFGMREYHLEPTTPPTLSGTNTFTNIPSDCKIYVPYSSDHSVLEAYQTATNWSTYASYMIEESA